MNTVVIGAYWGDEGKGKIVDLIAADADWVVRFNGGDNAGHTIVIGDKRVILHTLPSGVLQGKNVAIGPDVFLNPESFLKDCQEVVNKGFKIAGKILIDERTHLIMPYHISLDSSQEASGELKIGTTKRGIGPAAKDKASRTEDITIHDLLQKDFPKRLYAVLRAKKAELAERGIIKDEDELAKYSEAIASRYNKYAGKLRPFTGSVAYELNESIRHGKSIIVEGAQGALLDIVHGTRPYVTSSNTTAGGAFSNLGVNPREFTILGVAKAYPTRVGEGLFPTELKDELGRQIQKEGQEFGATTGRPRRVGMPDLVALKYSAMINGFDAFAVTKIDVLAGKKFKAAIAYEKEGAITARFPFKLDGWSPVYSDKEYYFERFTEQQAIEMAGQGYDSLPDPMKEYFRELVQFTQVPISMVSLSPKREITVRKNALQRTREHLQK
ncbi:adenylosuccinate synthase [Candidatus Woesearchaeota archaeon]|nr:adenylosuccinate synthase [Candidatus Woesearchaeota archaeon]